MTNLERIQAVDEAWNERRWDDYAAFLHADLAAFANDSPLPHDHDRHLERAHKFCATFPDAKVHDPYLTVFASADGMMTCTVARVTGRPAGASSGFDITMAVITRWQDGRMIEQRQFIDEQRMADQIATARLSSPNA